jgi:hypothetical protein
MHIRQPVMVLVGINSFFSFVTTVTPDFLGTTWDASQELIEDYLKTPYSFHP